MNISENKKTAISSLKTAKKLSDSFVEKCGKLTAAQSVEIATKFKNGEYDKAIADRMVGFPDHHFAEVDSVYLEGFIKYFLTQLYTGEYKK